MSDKQPIELKVGDKIKVATSTYILYDTAKLDARTLMPLVGLKRVD